MIMDSGDAERLVACGADKMIVVFEGKANRAGRRRPPGILMGKARDIRKESLVRRRETNS